MKKKHRFGRITLLVFLLVAAGGLFYYIYQAGDDPAEVSPAPAPYPADRTLASAPDAAPGEVKPPVDTVRTPSEADPVGQDPESERAPRVVTGAIRAPSPPDTRPDEPSIRDLPEIEDNGRQDHVDGSCEAIELDMLELFSYLDRKAYISDLELESGSYDRFRNIASALSENPPVPAGEGLDHTILLQNLYHLYRNLDMTDIRLIGRVLSREREDMEIYMRMIYRWLESADRCPDHTGVRPSDESLYLYASFFLNTTGGRAVKFRRDPVFRVLLSYYCILILHEANLEKRNFYGIDILPFIESLRKEIGYHPALIFRDHYLSELDNMYEYYGRTR